MALIYEVLSMDRRAFLSISAAASGYAAVEGFAPKLFAQSSVGPDPNLLNGMVSWHAYVGNNVQTGAATQSDWIGLWYNYNDLRNDWIGKNLDAQLIPAIQGVTSVDLTGLDANAVLQQWQAYNPGAQLSDVQAALGTLGNDPASTAAAVAFLQTQGVAGLLYQALVSCGRMSQTAVAPTTVAMVPHRLPPPLRARAHLRYAASRPAAPVDDPGSNRLYNCQTDGLIVLGVGLIFATIAVMSGLGVLAFAFWEGLSLWGGTAATLWGAGHAAKCGT
jgi:hypothetical protein